MLKKRIIPCLDIKDGRTVKGVQFLNLSDAGNPVELAEKYANDGADELVFLDITATEQQRKTLVKLVADVGAAIHIPFTVGGGISSIKSAAFVLDAGADKVSINSAAVKNPGLITQLAKRYGSQAIVLAIDAKPVGKSWEVFTGGGKTSTGFDVLTWAKQGVELGAGELLLTSMAHDGVKKGFDLALLRAVSNTISIPVIASGGAGCKEDFGELFLKTNISAGLAASIFHFNELTIPDLKKYLHTQQIPVRL